MSKQHYTMRIVVLETFDKEVNDYIDAGFEFVCIMSVGFDRLTEIAKVLFKYNAEEKKK